jgi:transposase
LTDRTCSLRGMPWKVSDPVKERTKFVLKWEERFELAQGGRVNVSELCRMFGVSRQTAHDWLKRYRKARSLDALVDRSSVPHNSPTKVSEEVEAMVVAARKQRPTWGARKLLHALVAAHPSTEWPKASCITTILDRHGLLKKRRKRRKAPVVAKLPFAACDRPNAVWCIDFNGKFRRRDGVWCYVLTLEDAYSRFLLRAEALVDPTGEDVERVLRWSVHRAVDPARDQRRARPARQTTAERTTRAAASHTRRGRPYTSSASSSAAACDRHLASVRGRRRAREIRSCAAPTSRVLDPLGPPAIHARARARRMSTARRASARAQLTAYAAGTRTLTRVPSPSFEDSSTEPPIASSVRLTIDRPSPCPGDDAPGAR